MLRARKGKEANLTPWDFWIEGGSESGQYVPLDKVRSTPWRNPGETRIWKFINTVAYTKYRIVVIDAYNDRKVASLSNLRFGV
jgi:hypothetical protein